MSDYFKLYPVRCYSCNRIIDTLGQEYDRLMDTEGMTSEEP